MKIVGGSSVPPTADLARMRVVTADDAYWLDDDLPHVRRWRGAEAKAV